MSGAKLHVIMDNAGYIRRYGYILHEDLIEGDKIEKKHEKTGLGTFLHFCRYFNALTHRRAVYILHGGG